MWVCYAIALIPVLVGAFLWLRSRRITFGEWMLGSAIGLLVAVGFHAWAIVTLTLDAKIVSGPVARATHWPKFSGGEDEDWWGEHWTVTLDLGDDREDLEIPREEFEAIREKFGATELETVRPDVRDPSDEEYRVFVARNRTGAVIPGWALRLSDRRHVGPGVFTFVDPPADAPLNPYPYPVSTARLDAWIQGLEESVTITDFQRYDWRRSKRLIGQAAEDFSIEAWDTLNAKVGPALGVNLIAIGFEGDAILARWQEAKWEGGKVNDLVICYGVAGEKEQPAWTYCFGWSDDEIVKRKLESLFLTRGPGDGIIDEIEREVRAHYRPREWPKAGWFRIDPPRRAIEILLLVTVVLQGGYWLRAFLNRDRREAADAVEEKEKEAEDGLAWEKQDRKRVAKRLKEKIAHLGRRPSVAVLREEMLRGREPLFACIALTKQRGIEARTALVVGLTSEHPGVRETAADWLNEHLPVPSGSDAARAAIPDLIIRLRAPHSVSRREARRVLELIDPAWRDHGDARSAIYDLKQKLNAVKPEPEVLDALGARGPLVYDDMVELLGDTTKATAAHALCVLGRIGDPRAAPILLEHLTGDLEVLARAALSGLAAFGPGLREVAERGRLVEAVLPRLAAAKPAERVNALLALGGLGDDRTVPDLVPFLADRARGMRQWTIEALGEFRTAAANEALIARLPEADESDRIEIVMALGRTRDPAIVSPLLELFEAVRGGGTLLPTEIVNAMYRFGGRDVERLLMACAGDFFCPARERAAKRLRDLRAGRTDPPWSGSMGS